jgi:Flp pilus assembly protein TadG
MLLSTIQRPAVAQTMKRLRTSRGQALVEVAAFFMAFAVLMAAFCSFTHWIAIRQRLLLAAKQGALLYSSGHYRQTEVKAVMRDFLKTGSPALDPANVSISIGRKSGAIAWTFELDEVRVRYTRPRGWHRVLLLGTSLEEVCVIRHAPRYWAPSQPWGGPGVPW